MPDFVERAKKLAHEHASIVDKAIEETGKLAEKKTGGRFDNLIQGAEQQGERYLGTDMPNGQDPTGPGGQP